MKIIKPIDFIAAQSAARVATSSPRLSDIERILWRTAMTWLADSYGLKIDKVKGEKDG